MMIAVFDFKNGKLDDSFIEEYVQDYGLYCELVNNGLTDSLNDKFKSENPGYFERNSDLEWYQLIDYNKFITDGYNKIIDEKINSKRENRLTYRVSEDEVQFIGTLKGTDIEISFHIEDI